MRITLKSLQKISVVLIEVPFPDILPEIGIKPGFKVFRVSHIIIKVVRIALLLSPPRFTKSSTGPFCDTL